jgi:hypothetical protein
MSDAYKISARWGARRLCKIFLSPRRLPERLIFPSILFDIRAWIDGIHGFLNLAITMQNETRYRMAGKARNYFDLNATVTKYIDL